MDIRRSGNYKPSIWDDEYVQSRPNLYAEEKYCERAEKLKEEVRRMLEKIMTNSLEQLELIDILQRLGIYYHFEEEIDTVLKQTYVSYNYNKRDLNNEEVYAVALEFRLLRQQGYHVPQEIFCSFMNKEGKFKTALVEDTKGLLSLYEASYLCMEDENIMENARDFATHFLMESLKKKKMDENVGEQVSHALEMPWMNLSSLLILLTGLACPHALHLFRSPNFYTIMSPKRPEYMKISFLALFNSMNELAYDILKEQGFSIISQIRKQWANLCKAYLLEVKWYQRGYTPTLDEFLRNAWITNTGPVLIMHAYFCITNPIKEDELECLKHYPAIIYSPSLILRLVNDLATSPDEIKKGDYLKSIQCYMHDSKCSEENARNYIKKLIDQTWKKMNRDILRDQSLISKDFRRTSMNLARIAQCMYQHGDGFGIPDRETKDRILSLFFEPIPLT